jgi:hypothetical protein
MKLADAKVKALQIWGEERLYPTVQYLPVNSSPASPSSIEGSLQSIKDLTARTVLDTNRMKNPRTMLQGKYRYQLHSNNYNLLVMLLGRVDEADRSSFLEVVADRINVFPACLKNQLASFPSWNSHSSELPMVAEFLARNGGRHLFFKTLA